MRRKRLKALIEEIEADPSRHNNSDWIIGLMSRHNTWDEDLGYIPERVKEYEGQIINCGTTGCLAGLGSLRYAPVGTKFWRDTLQEPDSNNFYSYETYGKEVLGLNEDEANYLFAGARTMKQIKAFSKLKKDARKEFLDDFFGY